MELGAALPGILKRGFPIRQDDQDHIFETKMQTSFSFSTIEVYSLECPLSQIGKDGSGHVTCSGQWRASRNLHGGGGGGF